VSIIFVSSLASFTVCNDWERCHTTPTHCVSVRTAFRCLCVYGHWGGGGGTQRRQTNAQTCYSFWFLCHELPRTRTSTLNACVAALRFFFFYSSPRLPPSHKHLRFCLPHRITFRQSCRAPAAQEKERKTGNSACVEHLFDNVALPFDAARRRALKPEQHSSIERATKYTALRSSREVSSNQGRLLRAPHHGFSATA
jgi:hypothetical protein